MRILEVVHGFPPDAQGGTEIYAHAHALALRRMGDEVLVLTREADPSAREYSVRRDTVDGVLVARVNNTFRDTRSFEETYCNPAIGRIAEQVIDEFRPDVAHVHHLTGLSTTIVPALAARGVPVFFTLHDYWLICHRGQLVDVHGAACARPAGCGACIGADAAAPSAVFALAPAARVIERALPSLFANPLLRTARGLARAAATRAAAADRERQRADHMRVLCAAVTRFFAPSSFMRERLVEFGVHPDRITVLELGIDGTPFQNIRRTTSSILRIGFVGSLMLTKAPHVLLEAYSRLPPGAAEVTLYGRLTPYHGDDSYFARLEPLCRVPGVRVAGPLPHREVPRALADVDVLVVPSTWPENSPLVIREAFLTGVPVVASRIGGIPDIVHDGKGGLLFESGNAADLQRVLTRLVEERGLVRSLVASIPPVRTIEEDVAETRTWYGAREGASWAAVNSTAEIDTAALDGILVRLGSHLPEIVRHAVLSGEYEVPERRLVAEFIGQDDVVMEVGTGLGVVAALCARRIGSDRVFTYEANIALENIIHDTFALNSVAPMLSMSCVARSRGRQPFFVGADLWNSSTVRHTGWPSRAIEVETVAIAAELDRIRPTFLLLDAEGDECDLLRDLDFGTLTKVAVELHQDITGSAGVAAVVDSLRHAGFELAPIVHPDVIFASR